MMSNNYLDKCHVTTDKSFGSFNDTRTYDKLKWSQINKFYLAIEYLKIMSFKNIQF